MGAGIAVKFREEFPLMHTNYFWLCRSGFFFPGQVFPWRPDHPDKPVIFNIASQFNPGADARLDALEIGLRYCKFYMESHRGLNHLGLPRIGAGIGGLTFEDVSATIERVFGDSDLNVTVVSLGE
jgi:hypothetical protein